MPLSLACVALVASFIPSTFAFGKVDVPTSITAGEDVQVVFTPNPDFVKSSKAIDYRLYLGAGFLSPRLPINESTTTVNIPKDVGPNDSSYKIEAWYAQTFDWSDDITLTGSTLANWSATEPIRMGLNDIVPCSAMNCYRKCNEKNHAEHKEGTWWTTAVLCSCLRKCPGVDTTRPYTDGSNRCGREWAFEDVNATKTSRSAGAEPTGTANSASPGTPSHSPSSTTTTSASEVVETATPGSATVGTAAIPSPSKAQAVRNQLYPSLMLIFGIASSLL